jgi:hypothetical protein
VAINEYVGQKGATAAFEKIVERGGGFEMLRKVKFLKFTTGRYIEIFFRS